jgi:hypothetical protein
VLADWPVTGAHDSQPSDLGAPLAKVGLLFDKVLTVGVSYAKPIPDPLAIGEGVTIQREKFLDFVAVLEPQTERVNDTAWVSCLPDAARRHAPKVHLGMKQFANPVMILRGDRAGERLPQPFTHIAEYASD